MKVDATKPKIDEAHTPCLVIIKINRTIEKSDERDQTPFGFDRSFDFGDVGMERRVVWRIAMENMATRVISQLMLHDLVTMARECFSISTTEEYHQTGTTFTDLCKY
jgi:hypothetical protein